MSFAHPLVLLGLLALPILIAAYARHQQARRRAAEAFAAPHLTPSVAPQQPGWRRHAPLTIAATAIAVLIAAAARPQRTLAKPVTNGAVMLADDISGSMAATDVSPTRERAARRAGAEFISKVPSTVQVGVLEFARTAAVLQSPTGDHGAAEQALARRPHFGGGTAIGEAILTAVDQLQHIPPIAGKHPPGAIVLISDGFSNVSIDPLRAARQAKAAHIPVYTVSIGTAHGTIQLTRDHRTVTTPVPVARQQLHQIATSSGGRAFTASNTAGVSAAYEHLAARLGRRIVKQEITADFAGTGLVLLLIGSATSLALFGRLI